MSASRRAQSVVSKGENVVVCVRLRPLNRLEERTKQRAAWTCTSQNEVLQSWAPDEAKVAGRSGPASHKAANIFAFGMLTLDLVLFTRVTLSCERRPAQAVRQTSIL